MSQSTGETYVGCCQHCGCFVAGRVIDGDNKGDAKAVADWIRRGLIVSRVPHEEIRRMSWEHTATCARGKQP
jgi:Rieske Fe-S protein